MKKKWFGKKQSGNALIEYALPLGILIVSVGIISTVVDINQVMSKYFAAASGHTESDISGGSLNAKPMAEGVSGVLGNGQAGFSSLGDAIFGGQYYSPSGRSGPRPEVSGSNGTNMAYGMSAANPLMAAALRGGGGAKGSKYVMMTLESGLADLAAAAAGAKIQGPDRNEILESKKAAIAMNRQLIREYAVNNIDEVESNGGIGALNENLRLFDKAIDAIEDMQTWADSPGEIQSKVETLLRIPIAKCQNVNCQATINLVDKINDADLIGNVPELATTQTGTPAAYEAEENMELLAEQGAFDPMSLSEYLTTEVAPALEVTGFNITYEISGTTAGVGDTSGSSAPVASEVTVTTTTSTAP